MLKWGMTDFRRFFSYVTALACLFYAGQVAMAACVNDDLGTCTTSEIRQIEWDATEKLYRYCDSVSWVSMQGTGTDGACSTEGELEYDSGNNRFEYCNGTNWVPMGVDDTLAACSTAGEKEYDSTYNVMSICNGTNWVEQLADEHATVPTDGLVMHWKFEDTNTTASDETGSYDGTMNGGLSGATDSVAGMRGNALDFDGVGDYIQVTNAFDPSTTDFTIAAWVNPDALDTSSRVVMHQQNGTGTGRSYIYSEPTTERAFSFQGNGTRDSKIGLGVGTWTHVAAVHNNSANTYTWYINGVLTSTSTGVNIESATGDFVIGANKAASGGFFDGQMDEFRIYNRALGAAEIRNLAVATGAPPPLTTTCADGTALDGGSLVTHLKFDDGTGNSTAADDTGNGNTGTLTNMDSASDWVAGIDNDALDFDNSNDFVRISDFYGSESAMTVSIWANADAWPGTGFDALVAQNENSGTTTIFEIVYVGSNGRIKAAIKTSSGTASAATQAPAATEWHHYAFTYDGSNLKLYVDGVLRKTTAHSGTLSSSTNIVTIGTKWSNNIYPTGIASIHFNGKLDDARFYDRALSEEEIGALYITTGNF